MLARLRALLARGATVRRASERLQQPRSTLHRWAVAAAAGLRQRRLSRDKERKLARLIDGDGSVREVGAAVGCGKSTVQRRRQARREPAAGEGLKRVPRWRCPGCGALIELEKCLVDGSRPAAAGTAGQAQRRA